LQFDLGAIQKIVGRHGSLAYRADLYFGYAYHLRDFGVIEPF